MKGRKMKWQILFIRTSILKKHNLYGCMISLAVTGKVWSGKELYGLVKAGNMEAEEVLEFWEGIRDRADIIDFKELLDEKLGYETPISYEDWIEKNHYQQIPQPETKWLYRQEQGYIESMKNITLKELAKQRIDEFKSALKKYMI